MTHAQHDAIWARQMPLNFPLEMYGFDRTEADMVKSTTRLPEVLATHTKDKMVPQSNEAVECHHKGHRQNDEREYFRVYSDRCLSFSSSD